MTIGVGGAVRDWLTGTLGSAWLEAIDAGDRALVEKLRSELDGEAFRTELGRSGYATPAWPSRYGGLGLDVADAVVVEDLLVHYEVPRTVADVITWTLAGPTILQWGTDEQRERYLPPMGRGAERWCQLFSEPGAGSDLAGLTTRAVRDGDGWRVTGQKVWSSLAHLSHFGLLLARTDPSAPKHQGITYFICDLASPGVDIRPLRSMTGESEFNEVFLDDVPVPDANRLGPLHGGWSVALSTLQAERTSLSGVPVVGRGATDELIETAGREGRWGEPAVRDRVVALFVAERALQMTRLLHHNRPVAQRSGIESSMTKVLQTRLSQRITETAVSIAGARGQAWTGETAPGAIGAFLLARAMTIAGGTTEIQKTIIAERALGLPRGP